MTNNIKIKNVVLAFKDQLPLKRFLRNFFITRNAWGMFSKYSHYRKDNVAKNSFPTKESAIKAANAMSKKHNVYFSNYKCIYCDGYHIGKNRSSVNAAKQ